jgi:hypothetical protein
MLGDGPQSIEVMNVKRYFGEQISSADECKGFVDKPELGDIVDTEM